MGSLVTNVQPIVRVLLFVERVGVFTNMAAIELKWMVETPRILTLVHHVEIVKVLLVVGANTTAWNSWVIKTIAKYGHIKDPACYGHVDDSSNQATPCKSIRPNLTIPNVHFDLELGFTLTK